MIEDEFDIANEYVDNIHVILGISNGEGQQDARQQSLDDRILHQQQLYKDAYTIMIEQQSNARPVYTSKDQQLLHSKLVAASWSALAAATNTVRGRSDISSSRSSSSIIIKAIETRNVVERLRLGFAMVLDCQMPSGREDSSGSGVIEELKENTFQ